MCAKVEGVGLRYVHLVQNSRSSNRTQKTSPFRGCAVLVNASPHVPPRDVTDAFPAENRLPPQSPAADLPSVPSVLSLRRSAISAARVSTAWSQSCWVVKNRLFEEALGMLIPLVVQECGLYHAKDIGQP